MSDGLSDLVSRTVECQAELVKILLTTKYAFELASCGLGSTSIQYRLGWSRTRPDDRRICGVVGLRKVLLIFGIAVLFGTV